jgi:hypothetical protein
VHAWSVEDHLTHRFSPDLGTGRVTAIEGRVLVVHFPHDGATLRLAATSDALMPQAEQSRRHDRSLLQRLAAGDVDDADDFLRDLAPCQLRTSISNFEERLRDTNLFREHSASAAGLDGQHYQRRANANVSQPQPAERIDASAR